MACLPVPRSEAGEFGVMKVDESDRIIEFPEKPADPPAMPGNPDMSLASMGIYIFNAAYLFQLLEEDMSTPAPATISARI